MEEYLGILLVALLALAGYLYTRQTKQIQPTERSSMSSTEKLEHIEVSKPKEKKKNGKKPTQSMEQVTKPKIQEHELLVHVLKGHTHAITSACFSPNGRFIATTSKDRTIRLTWRESLGNKNPTYITINIPYDYVTTCSFSSDGKTLGIITADNQSVHLYQKFKTKPECVHTFPIKQDCTSILLNDIGDEWMTIVSLGKDSDTELRCWNVQGDLLQATNINQIQNYHGVQSKDNRFIAVAAYTSEVKIYEIKRSKTGAFEKLHKAMALQGHTSGVLDVAFDGSDTTPVNHIVTTSKDGSVRLWDINVRYKLEEDPRCIKTFTSEEVYSSIDITPTGKILALANDTKLTFMRVDTMQPIVVIPNAQEDAITRIQFDATGAHILVQGTSSRLIKVYQTPTY